MKGWEVKFIEKIERAIGTKSFRFNRPDTMKYLPGQYFFISIPKEGGRKLVHHFSFSSSPTEKDFFEFTTRIRDSEFKQTLDKLPVGTEVQITEIHGEFTLLDDVKKAVFISGGIGITAALSNIAWAADTKAGIDIILLYANRNQSATAFREELDEMTGPGLKVVHILSEPEEGWKGPTGHIDADFIRSQAPDWSERIFYISGPPAMVEAVKKVLSEETGIDEERIKTENFLGY